MLKTIARVIGLCLLAWFFSSILEIILPLPTESMVQGFLDLQNSEFDRSLFKLLRYIVWITVLALAFRYVGPLFSFVLPITGRYSTTKPMRRFQGVFAEVFLFFILFLLVTLVITAWPSYKRYHDVFEVYKNDWQETFIDYHISLDNLVKANRDSAKRFVKANNIQFKVPFQIWPNEPSKTVLSYSIQDVIDHPEKYEWQQLKVNQYGADYYETKYDIRRTQGYQDLFKRQQETYNNIRVLDSTELSLPFNETFVAQNTKRAKAETWAVLGSPYKLIIAQGKEYALLIFLITLAIFIIDYFYKKKIIGKAHHHLLRFLEQGRFGFGGSARFAGLLEEWRTLYKNQRYGLFMGRSLYNPFLYIGLEDDRHMITIAGSRAGKGTTAIIPNLLLWEGSAVVIDPKGTNAAVTARRRKEIGQNVHLVDPFGILGKEEVASFNPLAMLDPESEHIREQIHMIAEALVVPDEHARERHWDDGARTIIAGLIAHLVSAPQFENPTLPMLRDLISMDNNAQTDLWAEMSMNEGVGRLAKDAAFRVMRGFGGTEIASILSSADKHTEWLSSPAMTKTLSSSSFDFADMKDTPTTIYLVLPPHYLETHNRFLRLFVNLAISQMAIGGRAKVPVLLLMDEFLALGKMNEVEKAFGLMAGYNLVMWPFIQDFGRLKHLYGSSVNAFIANSRAIQVFGVADQETKEFINTYLGERRLSKRAKIGGLNDVVHLRKIDEVAKDLEPEYNIEYILRSGKAPLILEKVIYFKSAPSKILVALGIAGKKGKGIFHGLYDKDPDYDAQ